MKTRGYVLLFVLMLSLLGVEGCPEEKTSGDLGAYIGGTNGMDISFVDEEPPMQVLDQDDPFYITLLVENMGEYTIPSGKIIATLSGVSKEAFNINSLSIKSSSDLFGKTKIGEEVIEGGLEELQFSQAEHKYDLPADFSTQLRADVCYLYKTNSLAKLCLKKNPIQRNQDDVCFVTNENVEIENSGSPLQISDVKTRAGSKSVTLTFVVENKGSGNVYEENSFSSNCILKQDKKDKISVEIKTRTAKLPIQCGVLEDSNKGVVRLINDRKTISCNIMTTSLQDTAFEEPVEIILDFFYKEAIGKTFTVVNAEY
jgi:hypothetical protein